MTAQQREDGTAEGQAEGFGSFTGFSPSPGGRSAAGFGAQRHAVEQIPWTTAALARPPAAVASQPGQGVGGGQPVEIVAGQSGPGGKVADIGQGRALAGGGDALGDGPGEPRFPQAEADAAIRSTPVVPVAGPPAAAPSPVAAGVLDQHRGRIEAHGLAVEQATEEGGGSWR